MRKLTHALLAALIGLIAVYTLVAISLCEGALHLRRKALTEQMRTLAEDNAQKLNAKMEDVKVAAFDGTTLRAWLFRPEQGNGDAVIVLHGQLDNRAGPAAFAPMLLRHHYAVLAPDSRDHGESGGNLATYGLYESRDVSSWVDWLTAQNYHGCVYGLGESMGAAVLLQALPKEPRLCAAVAESPYASFREVAYERLAQRWGGGAWAHRLLTVPLVSEAFVYARLRYGIDLNQVSPAHAVAWTRTPVLLVHGAKDFNIHLRHCQAILKNHSGVMEFWEVPGAEHTRAFATEPEEFELRVTDWFSRYSRR
jgi:dipeptidyl aminopeptidase/acylaminoacyl peptidase